MEYNENSRKNDDEHKDEKGKYNCPQMSMDSGYMYDYSMKICPMYGNPMYCPMFYKQNYNMAGCKRNDYYDPLESNKENDYYESDMRERDPIVQRPMYPYPGPFPGPYPGPYYPYNYMNPFLLTLPFIL